MPLLPAPVDTALNGTDPLIDHSRGGKPLRHSITVFAEAHGQAVFPHKRLDQVKKQWINRPRVTQGKPKRETRWTWSHFDFELVLTVVEDEASGPARHRGGRVPCGRDDFLKASGQLFRGVCVLLERHQDRFNPHGSLLLVRSSGQTGGRTSKKRKMMVL